MQSQTNGALAEWLGAGLQNLSQWFDSATHLKKTPFSDAERGFAVKKRCYNGATKYRSFSAFQKLIRKNPDTSYSIREVWYSKRSCLSAATFVAKILKFLHQSIFDYLCIRNR